ncbi:MAG: hypothetical protein LBB94_06995 [Clostridiales bacterium]|jgi:predicted GNAT family acetyltransferase|nr:hypothetical protein [Clostridiales bacterium]
MLSDKDILSALRAQLAIMMWQIGIDVLPEYRHLGIAAVLTNRLTIEILERGKIPYYGTAQRNIASQRVAHRAGLRPAWCDVW